MDDKVHYELQQLDIFSVDKLELCKFVSNRRIYCWILNFRSQLTNSGKLQIIRLPVIHCTSLFKKEVILLKYLNKILYNYIMAIKEINLISTPHLPPTINNNKKMLTLNIYPFIVVDIATQYSLFIQTIILTVNMKSTPEIRKTKPCAAISKCTNFGSVNRLSSRVQ